MLFHNEKQNLSREAKEYRNNYLRSVGNESTENVALVLYAIYKLRPMDNRYDKSARTLTGATQEEIAAATMLNLATVKTLLRMLSLPLFISRVKVNRAWRYAITSLGEDVLPYMLDESLFPGRKQKIVAIYATTRKDGANKGC